MKETAKHKKIFEEWYKNNRDTDKTVETLGTVSRMTIYRYISEFAWHNRADKRDAEAAIIAGRIAEQTQAQILIDHQEGAREIKGLALKALKEMAMDKYSDAVSAYFKAVELERKSVGLPEHILEISTLSDDDLDRRYADRIARISGYGGRIPSQAQSDSESVLDD